MRHEILEKNIGLMVIFVLIVISFGGLVEIVPLVMSQPSPAPGLKPLSALALEGRDVYIREGCHVCHTQMVRPLRAETERYGPYSEADEFIYDHPFLWGSKRTGPDLARVGQRYSDDWHRAHLFNPRDVVPESVMPSYPWLAKNLIMSEQTATKMSALKQLGVPYSEEDIANAQLLVSGKTEMDALIDYLQQLGTLSRATH